MTTPASATKGARGGTVAPPPRRWLALGLLSLAQLMLMLDVTVVNVALPAIGVHLHLDRPTLTWVLTAYTLAFGGLMLLGGRLADLLGARQVMLAGLAVFTGASLLSGLAANSTMLLAGRATQGIGAALLSPSALALVTTTFTGSERNKALGIWAAIGGAGAAIGVLVGGVLTSTAGWRWIFFINVPVGVLVLAVLPALVPGGRTRTGRAMVDVPGALAVTAATGAVIYGLISAGSHGWLTTRTLIPLGTAAVLYAVFAAIEHTVTAPLMDLRMLARRPVAAGAFLMLVGTGLLVGSFFPRLLLPPAAPGLQHPAHGPVVPASRGRHHPGRPGRQPCRRAPRRPPARLLRVRARRGRRRGRRSLAGHCHAGHWDECGRRGHRVILVTATTTALARMARTRPASARGSSTPSTNWAARSGSRQSPASPPPACSPPRSARPASHTASPSTPSQRWPPQCWPRWWPRPARHPPVPPRTPTKQGHRC